MFPGPSKLSQMELARPELALPCPGLAHLVLRRAQCAEGPAAWAGGARSRCAFRSGSRGASAGAEDLSGATADRPRDQVCVLEGRLWPRGAGGGGAPGEREGDAVLSVQAGGAEKKV